MKMTKWLMGGLTVMAAVFFLTSCSDDGDNAQPSSSRLEVYLTDAPSTYKEVWIDIQAVKVKAEAVDSAGEDGWTEVPMMHPGLYNLLELRNGKDTVLGAVDLPAGKVSQIRLVLGEDNSVVLEDGTEVPLKTPSAQQSGLKLNIHAELEAGIPYQLVLDFDAAKSIVKAGNSGNYILKPVIRTFAKATGGAIEGVVKPSEAGVWVYAVQDDDTISALPDADGDYKLWGLPTGAYKLIFSPDSTAGYVADTLTNIEVQVGEVTKVDPVTLETKQ